MNDTDIEFMKKKIAETKFANLKPNLESFKQEILRGKSIVFVKAKCELCGNEEHYRATNLIRKRYRKCHCILEKESEEADIKIRGIESQKAYEKGYLIANSSCEPILKMEYLNEILELNLSVSEVRKKYQVNREIFMRSLAFYDKTTYWRSIERMRRSRNMKGNKNGACTNGIRKELDTNKLKELILSGHRKETIARVFRVAPQTIEKHIDNLGLNDKWKQALKFRFNKAKNQFDIEKFHWEHIGKFKPQFIKWLDSIKSKDLGQAIKDVRCMQVRMLGLADLLKYVGSSLHTRITSRQKTLTNKNNPYCTRAFVRTRSEYMFETVLNSCNREWVTQYKVGNFFFDYHILDTNILIEVHGSAHTESALVVVEEDHQKEKNKMAEDKGFQVHEVYISKASSYLSQAMYDQLKSILERILSHQE